MLSRSELQIGDELKMRLAGQLRNITSISRSEKQFDLSDVELNKSFFVKFNLMDSTSYTSSGRT